MNSALLHRQASQTARTELHRRHKARQSLLAFTRYTYPDYAPGPHHHLLCDKLEAIEQGRISRLMVFMPPRHGKSELVSRRFPAWYLGRNPHRQIISASYGATLAQDFGRDVRNLVACRRFNVLFPTVTLSPDSTAKDLWHTNAGGLYTATGIGGGLTGRGADLAIIDDPVKDRQDAESPTRRAAVWDWYRAVLRTRLMPGGAIILAMTRWSPDDLAGRLLDDMQNHTGEDWHVLSLPALSQATPFQPAPSSLPTRFVPSSAQPTSQQPAPHAADPSRTGAPLFGSPTPNGPTFNAPTSGEPVLRPTIFSAATDALNRKPGAALWPQAFPETELARIRLAIGTREWNALYQQNPTPPEGTLFKTAFVTVVDAIPVVTGPSTNTNTNTNGQQPVSVRRWDLAATRASTRPNADWTVGVKMLRLPDGRFCVADVTRLRGDPAQVEAAILATASQDGAQTEIILPQDPGQAGVAQARYLTSRLAGYRVQTVRESGDKATRAAPFAAQVNAGNVLVLRAAWTPHFLEELGTFPTGAHDDQVDAAAGAFTALTHTAPLPRFTPTLLSRI